MKLILEIKNTENIESMTESDRMQMEQIVEALVSTGSLSGVKGGQVIIHFDATGLFQGVQLDYWPWRRRKQ
jgi:hypothetical protein